MTRAAQEASGNAKQAAIAALTRAQQDLEHAVRQIDLLPAVDVHSVALAAHALNSFLTVSGGVVELLLPVLRQHPDRQVTIWLEGLAHANDLMSHTVSQLMNNSVGVEVTPRLEDVDLARLVERACAYYRRAAEDKSLKLIFSVHGDVRRVRTDRVLTAAILDNLLSNAVKYSPPDRRIWVELRRARWRHLQRPRRRSGTEQRPAGAPLAAGHSSGTDPGGRRALRRLWPRDCPKLRRSPRRRAHVREHAQPRHHVLVLAADRSAASLKGKL